MSLESLTVANKPYLGHQVQVLLGRGDEKRALGIPWTVLGVGSRAEGIGRARMRGRGLH